MAADCTVYKELDRLKKPEIVEISKRVPSCHSERKVMETNKF